MRTAVVILAALAALSNEASAGTFVLRSSTTGVIAAPVVVPPEEPTIPLPPETPAGFMLSMTGQTSVAAGAALGLRPVVSGASGSVSYSYFGRLPLGATFDVATGRIAGKALKPGTYQVWLSATDSAGATVTAEIVIVVT
ncbi:putative Ig domain-containing protein [Neorhizobium sp. R1-B]|uniref:putative Ig domain-containing protein n=1 Tax=Neorhizobium sp. R1-B TaxID=2485162 RepID=UPI001065B1CC|nr:putative Ig domain-containing protein [Neorhizobium sp. R1-B]TDX76229.1 putative Ig domain-containing protein [Neorhizobium sp. R1-B]